MTKIHLISLRYNTPKPSAYNNITHFICRFYMVLAKELQSSELPTVSPSNYTNKDIENLADGLLMVQTIRSQAEFGKDIVVKCFSHSYNVGNLNTGEISFILARLDTVWWKQGKCCAEAWHFRVHTASASAQNLLSLRPVICFPVSSVSAIRRADLLSPTAAIFVFRIIGQTKSGTNYMFGNWPLLLTKVNLYWLKCLIQVSDGDKVFYVHFKNRISRNYILQREYVTPGFWDLWFLRDIWFAEQMHVRWCSCLIAADFFLFYVSLLIVSCPPPFFDQCRSDICTPSMLRYAKARYILHNICAWIYRRRQTLVSNNRMVPVNQNYTVESRFVSVHQVFHFTKLGKVTESLSFLESLKI